HGLPHRKRSGTKARCLLHPFECTERSIESRTVRVLSDARKPRVCIWILPRWFTLHSNPNKHLLHNLDIVRGACNPSLAKLSEEYRILAVKTNCEISGCRDVARFKVHFGFCLLSFLPIDRIDDSLR